MGYFTLTRILLILGMGFTFHVIGLALYRVFLHPLSSFPGPRIAAITHWYSAFYAWKGELHLRNREWHDKYGTYFRSGPNEVSFHSAEAMQVIYKLGVKPDIWCTFSTSGDRTTVLSERDTAAHKFKRGRISKMFSDLNMGAVERQVMQHITEFVELLGEQKHSIQDLCDWLSFDVISGLLFSQRSDMLKSATHRPISVAYTSINLRCLVCLVQPKIFKWKIDRVLFFFRRRQIIAAGKWISRMVRKRSESSDDQNDIYRLLTDPKKGDERLRYDAKGVWVESMLLFAAGADTTSTTLSALFFYLLHNPECLKRLTAEIRSEFANGNESKVTKYATGTGKENKLKSCLYLQACVQETMRLVPAVTNLSPRLVRPGGMYIGEVFVPNGTHVGGSLYTVLRNKDHFEQPDKFLPQRWIPKGISNPGKLTNCAGFIPFGTGLHSCIGKSLAKLQLELTVAKALLRYDLSLHPLAREGTAFPFRAWAVAKGIQPGGVEYCAQRAKRFHEFHPQ